MKCYYGIPPCHSYFPPSVNKIIGIRAMLARIWADERAVRPYKDLYPIGLSFEGRLGSLPSIGLTKVGDVEARLGKEICDLGFFLCLFVCNVLGI